MVKVHVKEIVGANAISMQSGDNLYQIIAPKILNQSEGIELDFSGVELFASPFFNSSIGLLLKDVDIKTLQERMKIINLSKVGSQLLNLVIENAIKFYSQNRNTIDHAALSDRDEN